MRLSATRLRVTSQTSSNIKFDSDTLSYIAAVETADGQALESVVKKAINTFVVGCKNDGTWSVIKSSCILAGARTLSGALIPLVGTAPTNFNFVSGDYNRKTGLVGNGSTKYLDSNRADNADPQDNSHRSVYLTTLPGSTTFSAYLGVVFTVPTRQSYIMRGLDLGGRMVVTERGGGAGGQTDVSGQQNALGFIGQSRNNANTHLARMTQTQYPLSSPSQPTLAANNYVFARNFNGAANSLTNARIAFYSIGESIDLALLDARVTTLINAFAAAIP